MQPVIEFQNVSKRYLIGAGSRSLRSMLTGLPLRLIGRKPAAPPELWALQDVSFEVNPGESIGIMGHNGAGKTTILKLLASITYPTRGTIQVRGRLGSLIELGAGFHPEMTGRENVYLNGVIMGMTRQEVARRFDSIVDFAGVEEFIDTPVKRYSSGMYVRLAFAVAAHIDPAVLLVDEVLAVGDIAFRAKCYRRMAELRKNGATIVLVSHDVYAIRDACDRALLLWHGQLLENGTPESVISTYLTRMQSLGTGPTAHPDEKSGLRVGTAFAKPESVKAKITGVTFLDAAGQVTQSIESGQPFSVEIRYSAQEKVLVPIFRVEFYRDGRFFTGCSTAYDEEPLKPIIGDGAMYLRIPGLYLPIGIYTISVIMAEEYEYNLLDAHAYAYPLLVLRAQDCRGDVPLPHTWQHYYPPAPAKDESGYA